MISDKYIEAIYSAAYGQNIHGTDSAELLDVYSPIDKHRLAQLPVASIDDYDQVVSELQETFLKWRQLPAPKRGAIVREIGEELRKEKDALGELITRETGKILEEGKGEVQEVIDIIDLAVGLSRQLHGLTIKSERPKHRMIEQWHPLGIVGVITAFNFPMAVWGWNAMLAAVCGDVVLWKPSEQAPLSALAINSIARRVAEKHGYPGVFGLVVDSDATLGKKIAEDRQIPLVSATGSTRMGREVAKVVGERLGKTILELGGNNAAIVLEDADLEQALPALVFGAIGTAGQRCTTTRRIIAHENIIDRLEAGLVKAFNSARIADPLKKRTIMGPLINDHAVEQYLQTISIAQDTGGEVLCGGSVLTGQPSNLYVEPTLIKAVPDLKIALQETFAPITYLFSCSSLEEAIEINNSAHEGLSSALFTDSLKNSGVFISAAGSDCGIANVNIGTSGAEIGGAFGGEKDTGGGRESGSDSWKAYMRRQTNTINFGSELPLAQGIKFKI